MPQRTQDIYASAPMLGLLADEAVAYIPDLRRCTGSRALLLSAASQDRPPNPPYLGQWVTLRLAQGRFQGDIHASATEPLPFLDQVFDLVLVRHALEPASLSLEEISRVLAPGGMLVLTGMNPLSGWIPWWLWQTRGSASHAMSPIQIAARLRRADLQVERVQRVGRALPLASKGSSEASRLLGGGYVLIARKNGPMSTPTRLRPKPVTTPVRAGLAPGARRSSVS
ncbi:methyltransferase domain-containing protein [Dyella sp. M7H15-1]|uniref:methyltransferase domain-containing protein n=1 Tax=Dyella sp. M7H15-1 TaxID=2501295 RepID=UPI001004FE8F|nr:methyltransferase domain-containing protein [Dyella sp. M7H15-1]QAU23702.1 methyltransferase domain-containing protein [Dyella sp. M7H15-1]